MVLPFPSSSSVNSSSSFLNSFSNSSSLENCLDEQNLNTKEFNDIENEYNNNDMSLPSLDTISNISSRSSSITSDIMSVKSRENINKFIDINIVNDSENSEEEVEENNEDDDETQVQFGIVMSFVTRFRAIAPLYYDSSRHKDLYNLFKNPNRKEINHLLNLEQVIQSESFKQQFVSFITGITTHINTDSNINTSTSLYTSLNKQINLKEQEDWSFPNCIILMSKKDTVLFSFSNLYNREFSIVFNIIKHTLENVFHQAESDWKYYNMLEEDSENNNFIIPKNVNFTHLITNRFSTNISFKCVIYCILVFTIISGNLSRFIHSFILNQQTTNENLSFNSNNLSSLPDLMIML